MNAGDVIFNFEGETGKLENSIKGLGSKIGSVASGIGKAFVSGTVVATGALAGLVGASISAAGDLEQQLGGMEAVFGDLAGSAFLTAGHSIEELTKNGAVEYLTLEQVAANAYEKMGVSANDYLATINKMGALMQGSGIDQATSLNLSAEAMQRAADVASIMGIDTASAMESIAGAAKGNFTMMDNLGVAMNATTIEAYALSKGIDKTYNEMTKAEQVGFAMEMFLEKTAYATGNYAKENATFAGSLNTLKASFSNFMSGAGTIDSVIESLSVFGEVAMSSLIEIAPKIISGISSLVSAIVTQLPAMITEVLPVLIQGAIGIVTELAAMLPTLITSLLPVLIDGGISLITGLVNLLPTLVPELISGFGDIFEDVANKLPGIVETLLPVLVQAAVDLIIGLVNMLPTLITTIVNIIPTLITALVNGLTQVWNALIQMMPTLIPLIINSILGLIPALLQHLPTFILAGVDMMLALALGMVDAIPIIVEQLPLIIDSIVKALTNPDMLTKLISAAIQLIVTLSVALIDAIPLLIEQMPTIIGSIFSGLWNAITNIDWGQLGKDIINGLIAGLGSMGNAIWESVKSVGDSIYNGFTSFFGIKSPARKMIYVGEMNAEGLMKGMDDMDGDIQKSFDNMFNLSPQLTGSASATINKGFSVTVNNSFEQDPLGQMVNNIKTFSGGAKNDNNFGYGGA